MNQPTDIKHVTNLPCIACGGPPVGMGMFKPTAQWMSEHELFLPEIPYTVCERHCELTDKAALEVVEAAINRRFGVERN